MGTGNSALIVKINLPKFYFIAGEIINGSFNLESKKGQKINLKNTNVIISFPVVESANCRGNFRQATSTLGSISLNFPQLLEINNNPKIEIPFQIQIPTNAKPSFEWPRDSYNVSYRNVLKIEIPEIKAVGTTILIIKKLSTPLNTPLNLVEHTQIKGIFSTDDVTLSAKYNTNSFPINSQIPFTFNADFSKSTNLIKEIEFILKRKIRFFDENQKIIKEIIDELQQKNVEGNMTKNQTVNFVADLIDPQEIYNKYCMEKLALSENLNKNEVINLIPNVKASLFECEYYIKVRAITDTPLISAFNSPSMYVPLDVFQADNKNNVNLNNNQIMYQQTPIQQQLMPQEQLNQQNENEQVEIPSLEEIMNQNAPARLDDSAAPPVQNIDNNNINNNYNIESYPNL